MPKAKAAATKAPKFSTIPISQLKPDKGNVRRHDKRSAEAIGASVKAFGAARSVVVDRDNILRAGNGTLAAAKAAGITEALVVEATGEQLVVVKRSGWSKAEAAAYGVADNRTTDLSRFDEPELASLLTRLAAEGAPLGSIGYTEPELARIMARDGVEERLSTGVAGSMGQRFGVPPFTTLDARQGYWQERKREWISIGLKSEIGRKVIAGSMNTGKGSAKNSLTGRLKRDPDDDSPVVSIFDPVLCEILYAWFCPPGGRMLDPFAGGSVRGIVAAVMGRGYAGIDLQAAQVEANREQWGEIKPRLKSATGAEPTDPEWVVGDSRDALKLLGSAKKAGGLFDFVFSCPPYADLEVYSDDERDLSTMTYADFAKAYRKIIESAVALLKPNRFACFVVGEARGKDGNYYGLVPDTIKAFQEAGAQLYNEAILITAIGSLPLCAGKIFSTTRKLGKTHQNVLVFVKGDSRAATEACGDVALPELPVAAEDA